MDIQAPLWKKAGMTPSEVSLTFYELKSLTGQSPTIEEIVAHYLSFDDIDQLLSEVEDEA